MHSTNFGRGLVVVGALATACFVGRALAEEPEKQPQPGEAAVKAAVAAIARVAAAASAPTTNTAALGKPFLDLATPGAPAVPVHAQAIDSAAQPYLADMEPRILELREKILDKRHRFLTGEDRVAEAKTIDFVTAAFDVRSIVGSWHEPFDAPKGDSQGAPAATEGTLKSHSIAISGGRLRDLIDTRIGDPADGGWVEIAAGTLLVHKPAAEMETIRTLLEKLRVETARRLSLEVTAYRLSREVRLDHAAAHSPEESARVLKEAIAAGKAIVLASRTAVIADGGVGHFASTGTRAFLAEESVNQTGVVPVVDPVISRLDLGLTGDVRATSAPGRPEVIVDLDLAFRELKELKKATIGEQELELPETIVTRCSTAVMIPFGDAVLAGGTFVGSEDAASACVFAVKAKRLAERVQPARSAAPEAPSAPALAKDPAGLPAVAELDALLAIVDEAIARIRAARTFELRLIDVRDILAGGELPRSAPRLGVQKHRSLLGRSEKAGAPADAKKADKAERYAGTGIDIDDSAYEGAMAVEPEKLEAIVKNATGADSAWGEPAGYETLGGEIFVRQTPGELFEIEQLLVSLRKDRTGNVEVQVDLCRVDDALLADLTSAGVTLPRDTIAKLDAAIGVGENASRLASGFVIARRGEIAVVHGGSEATYVAGFEHASGGTATTIQVVGLPLMGLVRQGLALEALGRGEVGGAEGTLTLGARLGLSRVTEMPATKTPGGFVVTPVCDDAGTAFEGIAPSGAVVLEVGRHLGEKRPAVVAVLRARTLR